MLCLFLSPLPHLSAISLPTKVWGYASCLSIATAPSRQIQWQVLGPHLHPVACLTLLTLGCPLICLGTPKFSQMRLSVCPVFIHLHSLRFCLGPFLSLFMLFLGEESNPAPSITVLKKSNSVIGIILIFPAPQITYPGSKSFRILTSDL